MNRSKPLGRGLSALIQKPADTALATQATEPSLPDGERVHQLPLELINRNRQQPRRD